MGAVRELENDLPVLAQQLADEPFCRKYALEKQSLAKIGLFIEQRETSLERVAPEDASLKDSFNRFKAGWCVFLMQMEQVSKVDTASMNTLTLGDFLSKNTAPPPVPMDDPQPIVVDLFAAPPEPTDSADHTVMGNIVNFVQHQKEEEKTVTGVEVLLGGPLDERTSSSIRVEPIDEINQAVDWTVPGVENKVRAAEPPLLQATHAGAQEYFAIAQYFHAQIKRVDSAIPIAHLFRLEVQQLCAAIELEFQERLAPYVAAFWKHRKEAFASLWDPASTKGDFHPALLARWDAASRNATLWPGNERLPIVTFKNSLRVIATSPDAAIPKLSPLEVGLWFFLFGQATSIDGFSLTNPLGLPSFEAEAVESVFLRLCRVHRMKNQIAKPSNLVTEREAQEMRDHADALFRFSQTWK